jgi:GntR family transcriptional regulator
MTTLLKTDGIPLYIQVRETLREVILDGTYEPGQRIPSQDELAEEFGVSRMTVRQGINELTEEGLLYRRHGVGTFVAQSRIDRDHTRLSNFFEDPAVQDLEPGLRLLDCRIIRADKHLAQALRIRAGDKVIRIDTLRLAGNQVVTLHHAHFPYDLFPNLVDEDLEANHVWVYIENKYGFRLKQAMQRLEARTPTREQARYLEIDEGEPILYKERTVFADDGTVVEFSECYNRADRYTCTVMLQR